MTLVNKIELERGIEACPSLRTGNRPNSIDHAMEGGHFALSLEGIIRIRAPAILRQSENTGSSALLNPSGYFS